MVKVLGHRVLPVVDFTGGQDRHRDGVGPELALTTLDIWEEWGADLLAPPSPLRIVGFVAAATSWRSRLKACADLRGLGSVLVVQERPATTHQLVRAQAYGAWVVAAGEVALQGRVGAVASAVRTPAHRLVEESLFACALAQGLLA